MPQKRNYRRHAKEETVVFRSILTRCNTATLQLSVDYGAVRNYCNKNVQLKRVKDVDFE